MPDAPRSTGEDVRDDALAALLVAARTLVAISAQSIAAALDEVDVVQFRILVVVASRGPCSLGGVAEAVGLHVSTASRTCDRMVAAGLINRAPSPTDRRNLELTLTPAGEAIVGRAMRRRRAALAEVLDRLDEPGQLHLTQSLLEFARAAGEPSDRALWAMGWTTDEPESQEVSS